jgi:hypothetical protein
MSEDAAAFFRPHIFAFAVRDLLFRAEYLFADARVAIDWLKDHGYLDIVAHCCDRRGSVLVCGLVTT